MKYTRSTADSLIYGGYLIIDAQGGMKLSRAEPALARGQRSIRLDVQVPRALFRTPMFRAEVKLPPEVVPSDITANIVLNMQEQIRAATGLDIVVNVAAGSPEPHPNYEVT